jgi:hypothetical protein
MGMGRRPRGRQQLRGALQRRSARAVARPRRPHPATSAATAPAPPCPGIKIALATSPTSAAVLSSLCFTPAASFRSILCGLGSGTSPTASDLLYLMAAARADMLLLRSGSTRGGCKEGDSCHEGNAQVAYSCCFYTFATHAEGAGPGLSCVGAQQARGCRALPPRAHAAPGGRPWHGERC